MVKSIKILGMKYKITNKMPDVLKTIPDGNVIYGYIDHITKTIWINTEYSNEEQWRAFWHEVLHGAMRRNGVAFSGLIEQGLEEILVETFASVIYEVIEQLGTRLHKE